MATNTSTPLNTGLLWVGSALLSAGVFLAVGEMIIPRLGGDVWVTYPALLGGILLLVGAYYGRRLSTPDSSSPSAFAARVLVASGVLWVAGGGLCGMIFLSTGITRPAVKDDIGAEVIAVALIIAAVSAAVGFVLWLAGRALKA